MARRRRSPLFLLGSVLLVASSLRPARAQLLGPEFQVNSYTTGYQSSPAVAADNAGSFVVVWASTGQAGGTYPDIFGQRFDPAGLPVGSEFQVNTYTTFAQFEPAAAMDGAGGFVVVWTSYAQDGSWEGVFGQRFDPAGLPVGGEFQVNSYSHSQQFTPAVAADGVGNFVVVWAGLYQDGNLSGIFGQRFDSAGQPAGSEFQVNTHTTNAQVAPALAVDGSGGFVVTWESNLQDGSGEGIFGRRFDSAGVPLGGEFQINSHTTFGQQSPAVSASVAGEFVVVWTSDLQDGWGVGVFGQRFDSAGLPVGGEFQVNSHTTGTQWFPAVRVDEAGRFVVVWSSENQDGSDFGVFGQRFDADGTSKGSELQVNSYTTSNQHFPAVTAGGPGDFVVVWHSYGQDGSYDAVIARQMQRFLAFSDGFEQGDACAWSAAVGGGCP